VTAVSKLEQSEEIETHLTQLEWEGGGRMREKYQSPHHRSEGCRDDEERSYF